MSRHGPSLPRLAAQKIISESKLTANQQNKNDTDLKSSSGLSRSHSPEMTPNRKKKPLPLKPKRKGELSVQTYGIKKAKQNRTWSKYTILTTHLYTCVIIIDITFFYIYFNEKHFILIYYCLLIFSFHFFIIRNVI